MRVETTQKAKHTKRNAQEMEDLIKKMRKEHEKMVKGRFDFTDAGGGWIDFTYRFFPGDPIQTIHIEHGEVCELPMGIVKHLNNCKKKVRKQNMDVLTKGLDAPAHCEVISRMKFIPVDFE